MTLSEQTDNEQMCIINAHLVTDMVMDFESDH